MSGAKCGRVRCTATPTAAVVEQRGAVTHVHVVNMQTCCRVQDTHFEMSQQRIGCRT